MSDKQQTPEEVAREVAKDVVAWMLDDTPERRKLATDLVLKDLQPLLDLIAERDDDIKWWVVMYDRLRLAAEDLRKENADRDAEIERLRSGWIYAKDRVPDNSDPVLLAIKNKFDHSHVIRAHHLKKGESEAFDDDGDFSEYNEDSDMFTWPEGWYEQNEYEDTNWHVAGDAIAWMPLPDMPAVKP